VTIAALIASVAGQATPEPTQDCSETISLFVAGAEACGSNFENTCAQACQDAISALLASDEHKACAESLQAGTVSVLESKKGECSAAPTTAAGAATVGLVAVTAALLL
jgi:hypothetical protein